MTMSLMSYDHHLLLLLLIVTLIINLLFLPAFCRQNFPLASPQGMIMEDKIRLGSTPPNCHNRCNRCNPCAPVQVPTLPTRSDPTGPARAAVRFPARPMDHQLAYDQYSNYKPLGWKCRCGVRLYNP